MLVDVVMQNIVRAKKSFAPQHYYDQNRLQFQEDAARIDIRIDEEQSYKSLFALSAFLDCSAYRSARNVPVVVPAAPEAVYPDGFTVTGSQGLWSAKTHHYNSHGNKTLNGRTFTHLRDYHAKNTSHVYRGSKRPAYQGSMTTEYTTAYQNATTTGYAYHRGRTTQYAYHGTTAYQGENTTQWQPPGQQKRKPPPPYRSNKRQKYHAV